MMDIFERTKDLYGIQAFNKLNSSSVTVCGLGGVGSYVAESLVRSGIGKIIVVDFDRVSPSNINRQLFALTSSVDNLKTDVAKARLFEINPDIEMVDISEKINDDFCLENLRSDYICDAIDDVDAKLKLIEFAQQNQIKIISAMGCANKTDASRLKVASIYKTEYCPLCKSVRTRMKKAGLNSVPVVYSDESPYNQELKRNLPSSVFVPAVAGLLMANFVVNDIIGVKAE